MARTKKSKSEPEEYFVYKVVPMGDGSMYGWKKFTPEGEVVEESQQRWPAALDAEKAVRALLNGSDRFETDGVHNINPEANRNVDIVKKTPVSDRFAGMTPVSKGIEDVQAEATGTENPQDPKQNADGNSAAKAREEAKKSK